MDGIIPWKEWVEIIRPYYYQNTRGRRAKDIETMLRMYLMQNWFNLSDEGIEDAIYDSYAMKKFLKIDFNEESVPDATTLLKFRHMLEQNLIGAKIFVDVKRRLDSVGLMMHGGTIVDAGTGYVHTITATAANVHDIEEAPKLLREDDTVGYGDAGYLGIQNRPEIKNDPNLKNIDFRINKRPSSIKVTEKIYRGFNWEQYIESRKSSVRCKVEHAFLIIKREFGYAKVAYRGIAKNLNRFMERAWNRR